MKKIKQFILTSIAFAIFPFLSFGKVTIIDALNNSKTVNQSVPFNGTMEAKFSPIYSFPILNNNQAIPDRLYKNVQLTEYDLVGDDDEAGALLFRKFIIPNSTNFLAVISFGGVTYLRTDILCIVSSTGQILSTLEATVAYENIKIKQFRINAQFQIIISFITTTQANSLPFSTFSSFSGQRKDIYYNINTQGQFVQQNEILFQSKTYTKTGLNNLNNIWEGGESPL